ncbi:MAG: DUF3786 domain-containing protein [Bacillota bacterium]|nr:DUF3786 domain-containing protein [Bacillota bacterium]
MSPAPSGGGQPGLDGPANEASRRQALRERCAEYRSRLAGRDPYTLARCAALGLRAPHDGEAGAEILLYGDCWGEAYTITWPRLEIAHAAGRPVELRTEALWLHYLDRADGHPLTGRWVNLSEIGGLFYQQAFQGYSGDELAWAWGAEVDALRGLCRAQGGWEVAGLGDMAFEWRALPRVPVCLCYRSPSEPAAAWATVLFDAASDHYVAADVAAIVGKQLTDRLMPPASGGVLL